MLERRLLLWENGANFFQLLHSDPFVTHWYYDVDGYKLCTFLFVLETIRTRRRDCALSLYCTVLHLCFQLEIQTS